MFSLGFCIGQKGSRGHKTTLPSTYSFRYFLAQLRRRFSSEITTRSAWHISISSGVPAASRDSRFYLFILPKISRQSMGHLFIPQKGSTSTKGNLYRGGHFLWLHLAGCQPLPSIKGNSKTNKPTYKCVRLVVY